MKICADTWFLVEIIDKEKSAIRLLEEIEKGSHELYLSAISIAEILTILYQKGKAQLAENIYAYILSTDHIHLISITPDMCVKLAKIKHSFGLSLVDAAMLTAYKISGAEVFIAKDSDYINAVKQNYVEVKSPKDLI